VIPLFDTVRTRHFPVLTLTLIAVNVLVFVVIELGAPSRVLASTAGPVRVNGMDLVTAEYGFVPCEAADRCSLGPDRVAFSHGVVVAVPHRPVAETVVTAMFLHGGWLHLLGNMLFLWVFGNNIEDRLGPVRFLLFYLLGGLAATALQLVASSSSAVPNIGASGAIAAVLGGYLLLYPRALVITYIPPIFLVPLPAVVFLVLWFGFQLLDASWSQVGTAGGVAYFAHVGGFVFGLATIRWWAHPAPEPRFG
jgi:membrane associated rhomboid family serine protease